MGGSGTVVALAALCLLALQVTPSAAAAKTAVAHKAGADDDFAKRGGGGRRFGYFDNYRYTPYSLWERYRKRAADFAFADPAAAAAADDDDEFAFAYNSQRKGDGGHKRDFAKRRGGDDFALRRPPGDFAKRDFAKRDFAKREDDFAFAWPGSRRPAPRA